MSLTSMFLANKESYFNIITHSLNSIVLILSSISLLIIVTIIMNPTSVYNVIDSLLIQTGEYQEYSGNGVFMFLQLFALLFMAFSLG
jgi:hypothetical protein